jgi:hypothetical protein
MSSVRKLATSNTNVSSRALSAADIHVISTLFVKFEKRSHGNADSAVWTYFGELAARSSEASSDVIAIDRDRRYCSLCLKREQDLYAKDKTGRSGHVSRVKTYSKSTATTSLADHLLTVHKVDVRESSEGGSTTCTSRQMSILDRLSAAKRSTSDKRPATSAYEFNRDLCLMMCVDLRPFSMVSDKGFATFCAKNIRAMALPDESTLRRGALQDLYRTLKVHVKNQLKSVVDSGGCLCIMFDGWTDLHE